MSFNPFDAEVMACPYPHMAQARHKAPVAWSAEAGAFVSAPAPIIFAEDSAETYLGPGLAPTPAVVCVALTSKLPEGLVVDACAPVTLVDDEP